jgi:GH25 family lysozyme M1 (1,4-beta-N-acetylmuramidase)
MGNIYFADLSDNNMDYQALTYADAGHLIIALKASEGVDYVNPKHRGWALQSGLEHVAVIHYHFARPDLGNTPEAEAQFFLRVTEGLLGPRDYVVLDLERATPQGWEHDPAWSRDFDQYIREHSHYRTILYASQSTLQGYTGWLFGAPLRSWDAAWGDGPDYAPPGYVCVFRQYTDGTVGPEPHGFAGIGSCDGNRMSKDIYNALACRC